MRLPDDPPDGLTEREAAIWKRIAWEAPHQDRPQRARRLALAATLMLSRGDRFGARVRMHDLGLTGIQRSRVVWGDSPGGLAAVMEATQLIYWANREDRRRIERKMRHAGLRLGADDDVLTVNEDDPCSTT